MSAMSIWTLAGNAGVGIETVRFYHQRRLLPLPRAFKGAYRVYGAEHADRIRFIKRAQELGFTLDEVAELLRLNDGTDRERARELAGTKLAQIEAKLADREKMARALRHPIHTCEHTGAAEPCPIIHLLVQRQHSQPPARPAT